MNRLNGLWKITQTWEGSSPYSFYAEFSYSGTTPDGSVYGTIFVPKNEVDNIGPFYGTYTSLGSTSYLSMSISDFNSTESDPEGRSTSSYIGNRLGYAMGGTVSGMQFGKPSSVPGTWSAIDSLIDEVEEKPFHVAEQTDIRHNKQ